MDDLNISTLKLKWKTKQVRQKAQLKLYSRSVFPLPLLFSRLSIIVFTDREIHETIPLQFQRCFSLFYSKTSSRKTFLVECLRTTRKARALQATSTCKRLEFWRETHTAMCLLIGRVIFLLRETTSFPILIGRIFFSCEKHRSLL